MDFWEDILRFAEETTAHVGARLAEEQGRVRSDIKKDGSLVTRSDRWSDSTIRRAITETFPDHGILTEESVQVFPGTEWCWVVDPIDGTTNFARGLPIWTISLGLLHRGVPVFGHVRAPLLSQSFHGYWMGNSGLDGPDGAFLNHVRIRTSRDAPSPNHFFNVCSRSISIVQHSFPCKIRMLGAATYNFLTVASGAVLGGVERTPKIWDIAAVWPILNAAGAVWTPLDDKTPFPLEEGKNYDGVSFPTLVACRGVEGRGFLDILNGPHGP